MKQFYKMTIRDGNKNHIFVFITDNDTDADTLAEKWAKQARVDIDNVYVTAIGKVNEPAFVCDRPDFLE